VPSASECEGRKPDSDSAIDTAAMLAVMQTRVGVSREMNTPDMPAMISSSRNTARPIPLSAAGKHAVLEVWHEAHFAIRVPRGTCLIS
jgi:hypothetical protein